jgi:hypothetical protein
MDIRKFARRQEHLITLLIRQMTAQERLAISWYMTRWEMERSRAEIVRANPGLSPRELKLKWVAATYGEELANGLRVDLDRRAAMGEYPMGI